IPKCAAPDCLPTLRLNIPPFLLLCFPWGSPFLASRWLSRKTKTDKSILLPLDVSSISYAPTPTARDSSARLPQSLAQIAPYLHAHPLRHFPCELIPLRGQTS